VARVGNQRAPVPEPVETGPPSALLHRTACRATKCAVAVKERGCVSTRSASASVGVGASGGQRGLRTRSTIAGKYTLAETRALMGVGLHA
jgi:hypothetical protein